MVKRLSGILLTAVLMITFVITCMTTVYAKTALKVTKQPASVTVAVNSSAKATVKAKGDGLKYKWYFKDKGSKKFSVTKSFKSNYYSVKMTKERSGRQVYCVITDKYGSKIKTKTVTLKMGTPLKITKQPSSVAAFSGDTAKVSLKAQGDGLTYKWYFKDSGSSKFSSTKSFKGNSYSVSMNKDRNGRQVYCVITDKYGKTVKTNTVKLSLKTPLKITKQPSSVAALNDTAAKISFKAQGDGLKYKWYFKDSGSSKFSSTSSFKSNSYSVTMNKSRSGRQVYCLVTDKYGSSVKTNTVTLSLKTPLKITNQPSSVVAINGATAKTSFKAQGDGLKYKWYFKDSGSSKFSSTSSFKSNYYSVAMSASRNGRQVYCVVTDKYGSSVRTNTVTLSLKTPLELTKQPVSVAVIDGDEAKVSFTVKGDGLKYKWYYKDAGSSKFSSTSSFKSNSYSLTMNKDRSGRQVYCVITDKYGSSVKTDTVTLDLKTPLEITKQPSSVVAPSGTTVKISFTATGDGLNYKWYFKDAGSSDFSIATSFKSNSYSVEMNKSLSGRQLYCVITDKYGTNVTTDTVTLNMGTPLSVTRQPYSVLAAKGDDVKINFEAVGEALTYKWYYKDKGSSKFSSTSTFTSNYYTAEMTTARNGRQIYCLVSDKFGNSVKTDVVTIKIGTPSIITIQPSSTAVAEGETAKIYIGVAGNGLTYKWYYKNAGASVYTLASGLTDNYYSTKMSAAADGREFFCIITDKDGFSVKTDTATLSMKPAYIITADTGYGDPLTVGVKKDGKYTLAEPVRPGYSFKGWQTLAGVSFAASGTVDRNVSVKAIWEIENTNSLKKLIERTNSGATEILITDNITINQPIYISHDVTIYSDKDYTLKRDPNYSGDMFVVGKDAKGVSALLNHRKAVLTLGGGEGTLTIDGNRSKMKVDVVGSVIFAGDSSTVNLYDGVRICNNFKIGNERLLTYMDSSTEDSISRAGGGAILNNNSTINMYGGIIDNNGVKTEHTIVTDAQGTETKTELSGCGGAVYNNGAFYMHGGTISNNQGLRGGAIYAARPTDLIAGTIQGNKSYTYGGAVSTSSSMNATVYIGSEDATKTMLFKDNVSVSAGGALYSNTSSPIVILGNAVFEGNRTDFSGGAIYTGGSLIVRDSTFRDNYGYYSGGAIYFHNTKDSTWTPRETEITGCVFENNTASLGGAVIFSRSNKADPKATGVTAAVKDCKFIGNKAAKTQENPGNGGAIYITQLADVTISECEFSENIAASSGGAVSVHSQSVVKISDSTFSKNNAVSGGALYLSSNSTSKLSKLTFTENKAVATETGTGGNGGAIYGYITNVTVSKLNIKNNSAFQHGGAVYLNATTVTFDKDSSIEGNSAGDHGGAFYLTYTKNQDGSRNGSKLTLNGTPLKSNTAKSGGAISIRSDCEAILDGVALTENSATATVDDIMGGGAVYVGAGKLSLNNVTMDKNTSAYYGGTVFSRDSEVTINGGSLTNSEGATGAALYFRENSTAKLSDISVTDNISTANGVIYINGGSLEMKNVTAENNKASNGGVLYASGASTAVNLSDCTLSGNSASANGGAVFNNQPTLTIKNSTFTENTAKLGGAVYNTLGIMTTENTAFTSNSAVKFSSGSGGNGGAVCLVGGTYTVSENDTFTDNKAENHAGAIYVSYLTDENDSTKRTGGILTATGASFTGNEAMGGGAVSIRTDCEASFDGTAFTENSVTGNDGKIDGYGEGGGAVYVGYGKLTLKNVTATGNTAENNGGAVHVLDSECTVSGTTFTENKATSTESNGKNGGGAISVSSGTLDVTDSTFDANASGYYGGAILSEKSTVEISSSEIKNSVGTTGAALCIRNNSTVTVKDTYITDNIANLNGVVYCNTSSLTMSNVTASGNKAVNGGVLYTSGSSTVVNLNDSTWSENSASIGGAVYMTNATVSVKNSTFESNTSPYGGALYSDRGALTTEGTTFNKNNADLNANGKGGNGGAVFLCGATYTAADSDKFTDNTAAGHAGAIYVSYYTNETDNTQLGAILTVPAATFSGNTAKAGGAVSIRSKSAATFTGTTFTGNIATSAEKTEGGGAVYVGYGALTLDGTTMKENSTGFYGGAVSVAGSTVEVKNKAVFDNNSGITGTAMQIRDESTVTFDDVEITNNIASDNGNGTVYITSSGSLTMTNITASGNENANGGVIYASGTASVTVSESTFDKNNAKSNGGAIAYNAEGKLNLNEVTFTGNTAKHGGAVFTNKETAELIFTDCTFTENSAVQGGAVYTESASVSVVRGSMSENTSNLGGAIYNRLGTLTLTEAEFTENHATKNETGGNGNGGAIALGGGSVSGTAVLKKNTAENHAGGLYLSYTKVDDKSVPSTANITGSEFAENTAMGGGAVSIRSDCSGIFENVTFTDNSVSGYIDDGDDTTVDNNGDGEGGGAIYVGFGSVTLNNVTASGNKSVDTFGGFLDAVKATVNVSGGSYTTNSAMTGGAFYGMTKSNITITDATVSNNESTFVQTTYDSNKGGGAVAVTDSTLNISGTTLSGNTADYYGGAIHSNGATVVISNNTTLSDTTAGTGAVLYSKGGSKVTITDSAITNNSSSANGVVYQNGGTLDMTRVTASGNTAKSGGVLFVSGASTKVNIDDSTWSGNSANNGGAIYFENATVTLTKCTLTDNSATLGGAVHNKAGTLTVDNSAFTKNKSSKDSAGGSGNGGAVYINGGTMNASDTVSFTENSAENHGGAIYVAYINNEDGTKTGGTINMTGGHFENNTAFAGGAISSRTAGTVNLTGTTLKNNSATCPQSGGAGGGAIYSNDNSLTLSGVILDGNTTAYYGGAIYGVSVNAQIKDSTQLKNNSGVTGAALYFSGNSKVTLDTAEVTSNNASSNGVLYINSGSLEMKNVVASGNKGNNGGIIYASGSANISVDGGSYTGNTAKSGGGVFDWRSGGTLTAANAVFSSNTAKDGGVINTPQTAEFTNCTFSENTATNGGVAYATGTVTFSGCTITKNTAAEKGGAIFATGNTASVTVKDASLLSENSAVYGGAVYMEQDAVVNIDSSTLELNTATDGGAIHVAETAAETIAATLNLNGATVKNNTASALGGGIYMISNGASIVDSTFKANTSILGGAIHNRLGEITSSGTTFTENTAILDSNEKNGNGGAIVINGGIYTSSANDTFTNNTAAGHAGAIYVTYVNNEDGTKTGGVLNMTGGHFENNTAFAGGAISSRTAGTVNLTGTTLKNNSATCPQSGGAGGGAIYSNDNSLTLSGVTLEGNATGYYGGAIYGVNVNAQIKDSTQIKNHSGVTGAALYFSGNSKVTLDTAEVTSNNASSNGVLYINSGSLEMKNVVASGNKGNNGGIIYASGSANISVDGGSYTGNTAKNGGGVFDWRSSGTLTAANAVFSGNTAKDGGVINTPQTAEFTNCTFSENTATNGGVAYATGTVTFSGCTITKNTAAEKGGAIFATGNTASVTVKDASLLSENTAVYGGAVYMEQDAVVNIDSSTLELNTATDGGAIHVAETAAETITATLNLNGATVKNNTASALGGGIYMISNGASIVDSTFKTNTSILGGAIHNRLGELTSSGTTFTENAAILDSNEKNGNGGAVAVVGGIYTSSGNDTFTNNTAIGHAGAVYSSYVTNEGTDNTPGILNIGASSFTGNTAASGGAVSVRTGCTVNAVSAVFTGNSASAVENTTGGGAIYAGWGSANLDGCTFDGNSSGFYGGAVAAPGSAVSVSNGTEFKNNTGATGTAVYLRDGGSGTLTDVTLTDNIGTAGNGTVYITGNGTLNMTNVTATGNQNSNGAVVYASGSAKVNITGGNYTENTASGLGGVLDIRTSGPVIVSGGTFSKNTANKGGMLHATGSSVNVTIENAVQIKENTATTGGAIFMDLGAKVTIKNSTIDGNSSTYDGGAIQVADTGKETASATELIMNNTTLQNNSSAARGGALATDTSSTDLIIKATDCTFYKNKSTTSGGAVSVQNGNCNSATDPTKVPIVFTNCIFRENESTTDGGALDLRSGSCLKIDGMTAEGNAATGNAGVVYVTSNNTRLYITGDVTCTDNTTSKSGKFSYLYNNNYTTPPKIYTTHSNTAAWYADVAGNKTNVAFDLTTLP